ncbi:MAG: S8 family serine peptidase [Prevotella sp.]|nr:S8 family serine peptidase [Prevotella sp.]
MKKVVFLFVLLFANTSIFGQLGYRYGSAFIELHPDNSSLYFVQTKDAGQMTKMKEVIKSNSDGTKVIGDLADNACIVNNKSLGEGNYISDIYKNNNGHKLIILPRFAIKMKAGYKIHEVLTVFGENLSLDEKEINIYKVDCNLNNSVEVLTLNKEINALESVEWCEPMMIGEAQKHNTLYGSQYYLKNTGQNEGTIGVDINVEPVWNFLNVDTTLVVAVLDDGVERNHEDLVGSVLPGMTIDYPNEYGDPIDYPLYGVTRFHGTACAGIIAARNNSIGIRGVASGVKILPINIDPYYTTPPEYNLYPYLWFEMVGQAITWAYTHGADIISCSQGFSNNTYISNAITNAINNGRNGKGTVVVCSSGNSSSSNGVSFPANMSNTIAVGAIDKNGDVWSYSNGGEDLDIVAPSGDNSIYADVVTTDRTAPNGYNPAGNYMSNFGGTSAACPQVAGVVALMLSANPNLTASQVRTVLRNTARDVNSYGFDYATGCGLVDAYGAVNASFAAQITEISGPTIPGLLTNYSVLNVPSGWSVVWSMQGKTTLPNYCTANFPAAHQLQINNSSKRHIKETLVAKVYRTDGVLVKTLTKSINTADGFTGTYSQTIPLPNQSISGQLTDGCVLDVQQGYNVTLTSTDFNGATITYESFDTPTISSSGNTITFRFHTSTDLSFCLLHIVKGNKVIEFSLRADAALHLNPDLLLMAITSGDGGSSINIELSENADSDEPLRSNAFDSWDLAIYSYTTGRVVYAGKMSGPSVSIDSSKWEPDIYVVCIKVNGKEIVQKFIIE